MKIAFDFAIIWIEDGNSNQLELRLVIDELPTITILSFWWTKWTKIWHHDFFYCNIYSVQSRSGNIARQIDFNLFSPPEISALNLGCFDYTRKIFEAPTPILPIDSFRHRTIFDIESLSSRNYSNFAMECEWNSDFSQSVQNLRLLWKKLIVFFRKSGIFSKITKGSIFAVECVSNNIVSENWLLHLLCQVFPQKSVSFQSWKN